MARATILVMIGLTVLVADPRLARAAPDATTVAESRWRPAEELRQRERRAKYRLASSVLMPVAGALAITGGVLLAVSKVQADDVADADPGSPFPREKFEAAKKARTIGAVFLATGIGAFVAAATLFGLSRRREKRRRVQLTPWVGAGAGVTVQGRF